MNSDNFEVFLKIDLTVVYESFGSLPLFITIFPPYRVMMLAVGLTLQTGLMGPLSLAEQCPVHPAGLPGTPATSPSFQHCVAAGVTCKHPATVVHESNSISSAAYLSEK